MFSSQHRDFPLSNLMTSQLSLLCGVIISNKSPHILVGVYIPTFTVICLLSLEICIACNYFITNFIGEFSSGHNWINQQCDTLISARAFLVEWFLFFITNFSYFTWLHSVQTCFFLPWLLLRVMQTISVLLICFCHLDICYQILIA